MKTTLDLLDLDLTFSQRSLLSTRSFVHECERRGFYLRDRELGAAHLDALHRAGALVPLYRVGNDLRPLFAAAREQDTDAFNRAYAEHGTRGTTVRWLHHYRVLGRLHDPHVEPHRPWGAYRRLIESVPVWASEFLYSPYQLLSIPDLRPLPSVVRIHTRPDDYRYRFRLTSAQQEAWMEAAAANRELVIVLSALEPKYLPDIINEVRHLGGGRLEVVQRYQQAFDPAVMLTRLGWSADQVRETAERLLIGAARIDPLGDWHELVRAGLPARWKQLRFNALVAIEHRIAAEMLLSFYEDLVGAGLARALELPPRRNQFPWQHRLVARDTDLDALLTHFDLSPHPSVVLVLEGESELGLAPRVMDLLEIPRRRDYIELENAHGVDQPLSHLASYVTPHLAMTMVGRGASGAPGSCFHRARSH